MQDRNTLPLSVVKQTYRRSNETGQKAQDNEKEYMHVQLFGCQLARQEGTEGGKTSQPPTVERA